MEQQLSSQTVRTQTMKLHGRRTEGKESDRRRQVTQETLLKLMMRVMSMMSSIMGCDVEQYIRLGPPAIQREYGIR